MLGAFEVVAVEPAFSRGVNEINARVPAVSAASSRPTTAAASAAVSVATNAAGESSTNPYIQIVMKRLRSQKKKLARVVLYEEQYRVEAKLGATTLNADQIKAVEKKGEILSGIRDLEEIVRAMLDKEAEETKAAKKAAKEAAQAERRGNFKALQEAQAQHSAQQQDLLRFVYAANSLLPSNVSAEYVSVDERNELMALWDAISYNQTHRASEDDASKQKTHLQSYLTRSENMFDRHSYAQLVDLISDMIEKYNAHLAYDSKEVDEIQQELTGSDSLVGSVVNTSAPLDDTAIITFGTIPAGGLNFMQEPRFDGESLAQNPAEPAKTEFETDAVDAVEVADAVAEEISQLVDEMAIAQEGTNWGDEMLNAAGLDPQTWGATIEAVAAANQPTQAPLAGPGYIVDKDGFIQKQSRQRAPNNNGNNNGRGGRNNGAGRNGRSGAFKDGRVNSNGSRKERPERSERAARPDSGKSRPETSNGEARQGDVKPRADGEYKPRRPRTDRAPRQERPARAPKTLE